MVTIIVATDSKGGIGKGGTIPWKSKADMRWFRKATSFPYVDGEQNTLIMGWVTWESLGCKPLPNRLNIVLSKGASRKVPEGVLVCSSLEDALLKSTNTIFIIGGASVYENALKEGVVSDILVSRIPGTFDCDRFFPGDTAFIKAETWGDETHLLVERYVPRDDPWKDSMVKALFDSVD